MATGSKRPQNPANAADAHVVVSETGDATAASEGTAVAGYRSPVPGTNSVPAVSVQVTGTGHATASEGGLANTGHIEQLTVVQQRAPREPAAWPHQVGVIPCRAQSFQHRAAAEMLRAVVEGGDIAVLGQVLTGMGGVGKTQLAADYALTAWDNGSGNALDVLVWVTASARSGVVAGYAQAGVELCRADPDNSEQAARTFLAWLTPKAGAQPCRWLMMLDDVADPDILRGLWPPASPYGRTLITTRRRDAALTGEGRRGIEVGLFTEAEAVTYLTRCLAAHGREEPKDQLTALASELGHLPMALSQAAAYLIDSGEEVRAYRELLADRSHMLADTAPDRLPDEQATPLAASWSLSLDRADTLRPVGLARPMLRLVALLDPNGIPQAVLTSETVLDCLTKHRAARAAGQAGTRHVTERDALAALRALHRLSLIDHTPSTPHQAVRVHQLIQRATRDTLSPDRHDHLVRAAADALLATWPALGPSGTAEASLRANADTLTHHSKGSLHHPALHGVLTRTGRSLGETGQVNAAAEYFNRLAEAARRRLGSGHPDSLAARRQAASWRGETGDSAGAVAALEPLLEDMLRVLGPQHADTLTARNDLAKWRGVNGDPAGAVATLEPLLEDMLRVLGPQHPDTLTARNDLAWWRGRAGDRAGAVTAFEELQADQERALGQITPTPCCLQAILLGAVERQVILPARSLSLSHCWSGCLRHSEQITAYLSLPRTPTPSNWGRLVTLQGLSERWSPS